MGRINNMIHAEINGAESGVYASVQIRLAGDHTITVFQEDQSKADAIAAAINEAVARHDAANAGA